MITSWGFIHFHKKIFCTYIQLGQTYCKIEKDNRGKLHFDLMKQMEIGINIQRRLDMIDTEGIEPFVLQM